MAATIARGYGRMLHCINGVKHLQLHNASLPKDQNFAVLKNVHRSAWYRSFFRTDQSSSSEPASPKGSQNASDSNLKPKRPPNVFLLYLQTVRDDIVRQSNGDKKGMDIIFEAAKLWKELDPEEKAKLALERKEMYEKYKKEKMVYMENMSPEQIREEEKEKDKNAKKKLKKARRLLEMPVRPLTSYKWFMIDKFDERCDEPIQTFFRQAKDQWNNLSESEKQVYYQKQKMSQETYKNEMAKWEEQMISEGRFDVIRKSTLTKVKKGGNKVKSKKKTKANEENPIE